MKNDFKKRENSMLITCDFDLLFDNKGNLCYKSDNYIAQFFACLIKCLFFFERGVCFNPEKISSKLCFLVSIA